MAAYSTTNIRLGIGSTSRLEIVIIYAIIAYINSITGRIIIKWVLFPYFLLVYNLSIVPQHMQLFPF